MLSSTLAPLALLALVSIPPPASKKRKSTTRSSGKANKRSKITSLSLLKPPARRRAPTARYSSTARRKARYTQPPSTRARYTSREPLNEAKVGPSAGSAAAPLLVDNAVLLDTVQEVVEKDKPF